MFTSGARGIRGDAKVIHGMNMYVTSSNKGIRCDGVIDLYSIKTSTLEWVLQSPMRAHTFLVPPFFFTTGKHYRDYNPSCNVVPGVAQDGRVRAVLIKASHHTSTGDALRYSIFYGPRHSFSLRSAYNSEIHRYR